jgi:hypothetical protein
VRNSGNPTKVLRTLPLNASLHVFRDSPELPELRLGSTRVARDKPDTLQAFRGIGYKCLG